MVRYGVNYADIGGEIVTAPELSHEVSGEKFYQFKVNARRLSGVEDILPVIVSERDIIVEEMTLGRTVRIDGQIRTYRLYVEADKKDRHVVTVFARDVNLDAALPNSLNHVVLDGFICKPVMYRVTPLGREISDLLIAVNRANHKSDYIPCIAWGKHAHRASRMAVGDQVRLEGRLQSRTYEKLQDDGQVLERIAYEVSICKVETVNGNNQSNTF